MAKHRELSRRDFLGGLGSISFLQATASGFQNSGESQPCDFAYVASRSTDASREGVHVFRVDRGHWTHVQFVATPAPTALITSQHGSLLFVANATDRYLHRPSGSVESYRICSKTGRLEWLSRQPLSLSTTRPAHLALSHDDRLLAVSSTSGSTFTLFPVSDQGTIAPFTSLRKELQYGPDFLHQHAANPQQILFDPESRLISANRGTPHLSVYRSDDGALPIHARHITEDESSPSGHLIHLHSGCLITGDSISGSLYAHEYSQGQISNTTVANPFDLSMGGCSGLTKASDDFIVSSWSSSSASGIRSWRKKNNLLRHVDQWTGKERSFSALTIAPQDGSIYAVDTRNERMERFLLDRTTGELTPSAGGTTLSSPAAVAWYSPRLPQS